MTAIALWISTVLPGINLTGGSTLEKVLTLLVVALIFGIVNAVLRPISMLLGLPIIILTLGIFALVINALLFWFTGWLSHALNLPFEVTGFWSAFFGAIIVGVVSWVLNLALAKEEQPA